MNRDDLKKLFGDVDPTTLSQEELDRHVKGWNDRPIDDFCGLSPVQMDALLHDPLGEFSPIRVRKEIDQLTFEGIPFFQLVEKLLTIVDREEEIRLTATGALPPRFVRKLYEMRILPQYDIEHGISKLSKEADWPALEGAHIVAVSAGLIREGKKRMVLTRKGKGYLDRGERRELFIEVLRGYTKKLNWGYFEYQERDEVAQFGWGYTTFLLLLFGEKPRPVTFYADLYSRAFPMVYSVEKNESKTYPVSPLDRFVNSYSSRTFDTCFKWFGWLTEGPDESFGRGDKVVASSVFREVFATTEEKR